MLANLTEDNQIALLPAVATLAPGARYFEVSSEDGRIVLTPVRMDDVEDARAWAPELVKTARGWLAQADREFAAERDLVASRYLWEAVRAAVTAVGVKRGTAVENDAELFALVAAPDKEYGLNHALLSEFGVARLFKRNAEEIDNYRDSGWDGFEFETGRPAVNRLIERLAEMASAETGH